MSEIANIPQLRFSGFDGDWKEKKLGDVGSFHGGGTPSKSISHYWVGDIPWISSSDINEYDIHNIRINRFINRTSIRESATKIIPKGSVLFVSRVGVGKLAINKASVCTSQDFTSLTPKNDCSYFLGYFFLAKNKLLIRYSQGTSIKGFTVNDIRALKLYLPILQEQQKIAAFLTAVDNKIEQLSKKQELLGEYKKGVMQKIFSQEIRFKADDGSAFPDWEEKSLIKIFKERKLSATKADGYEHISLTTEGVVPKSKRYERDFLVSDDALKKYKLTKLNDICYNPANLKFGVICRNKYGEGIFSPIYVTLEVINADTKFVEYFITRWDFINRVRKYEEGTVYERQAVKPKDFLKFSIAIPSIEEQTKIANFLSSIDNKIEQVIKQLDESKQFKKALLQQMFV